MTSANKFRIGLGFNSQVVLERMHCAVRNPDPAAVEAAQHEAIEFFVIDTAGVREEADRDLFSELETSDAVGAEVHAGSIPRQRDVCGEFVDLGPQGELLAPPRLHPHAVRTHLDGVCDDVALVEKCLKHGRARARIHGVGGGIGRVGSPPNRLAAKAMSQSAPWCAPPHRFPEWPDIGRRICDR